MPEHGSEIPDSEDIFRRIPFGYLDRGNGAVNYLAFIPTEMDHDGLSVDLASLTTAREVATRPANGKQYHVLRINVGALRRLVPDARLVVRASPRADNAAHCSIPAMSRSIYEANKPALKALANAIVAELQRPGNQLGSLVLVAPG